MVPKRDTLSSATPPEVQLLVNTVMSWAEERLRTDGRLPAAAVLLPRDTGQPNLQVGLQDLSIAGQEQALTEAARAAWAVGELAAVLLAAPVLYGKTGSGERAQAVRLHVETATGYCADVLMPYRIRPASRWRRNAGNRVHFTHPVAQESDSRFLPGRN